MSAYIGSSTAGQPEMREGTTVFNCIQSCTVPVYNTSLLAGLSTFCNQVALIEINIFHQLQKKHRDSVSSRGKAHWVSFVKCPIRIFRSRLTDSSNSNS